MPTRGRCRPGGAPRPRRATAPRRARRRRRRRREDRRRRRGRERDPHRLALERPGRGAPHLPPVPEGRAGGVHAASRGEPSHDRRGSSAVRMVAHLPLVAAARQAVMQEGVVRGSLRCAGSALHALETPQPSEGRAVGRGHRDEQRRPRVQLGGGRRMAAAAARRRADAHPDRLLPPARARERRGALEAPQRVPRKRLPGNGPGAHEDRAVSLPPPGRGRRQVAGAGTAPPPTRTRAAAPERRRRSAGRPSPHRCPRRRRTAPARRAAGRRASSPRLRPSKRRKALRGERATRACEREEESL